MPTYVIERANQKGEFYQIGALIFVMDLDEITNKYGEYIVQGNRLTLPSPIDASDLRKFEEKFYPVRVSEVQ